MYLEQQCVQSLRLLLLRRVFGCTQTEFLTVYALSDCTQPPEAVTCCRRICTRGYQQGMDPCSAALRVLSTCCTSPQEATELSELFRRVEGVFAGGDVAAMAALLSRMRGSLALVGHVPEFAGGLERLEVRTASFLRQRYLCKG